MLVASVPSLQNNLFGLLFSSIACTAMFAFMSWHLVEKRFLRLRKYFSPQSAKIAEVLHPALKVEGKSCAIAPDTIVRMWRFTVSRLKPLEYVAGAQWLSPPLRITE